MRTLALLDYLALLNMLCFWLFYDMYSKYRVRKGANALVSVSNSLRVHWVHNLVGYSSKDRIPDAQLVNTLHRGISFFISITIFTIAGLMAMLTSSEALLSVLGKLPFHAGNAVDTWNIKIIFMIIVFVVAFFRLTWALRQSQYYAIAIFGAPNVGLQDKNRHQIIKRIAKLMSDSGKNFNQALRSYYFGLSIMLWLIHPLLFMASTILVVWVIYRREFHSKTFHMLHEINQVYNEIDDSRYFPK